MAKRKAKDVDPPNASTPVKKVKTTAKAGSDLKAAAKYTSIQERAIAEFSHVTQADKNSAAKALKQNGWSVGTAINAFFNGSPNAPNASRPKLEKIFDGYREDPKELPDEVNFEGVGQLLGDLGVGLEDIGALVLFEIVQSPQLGKITREGFVDGFSESHADSTTKLRNVVLARRAKLSTDRTTFKSVYNHTFTLLIEDRKKAIDLDQAGEFWKLLFSEDGFEWRSENVEWLDWWLEFLNAKWNKAVNKDLWRQTLAFAEASKKDENLTFWTEESSWPSVIDDFVAWVKAEKFRGGDKMDLE
ncbi:hypothetical protein AMS68_000292 [Peltaster fructicola]|uniref:Defective in cullin neddylation protein n=1 Tax=Peltaster fructicola TaxID=286661 RepID=A0A6H0XJH0_9PEZI|nr:hypothetical protein AMS68_000292 [Peltaster fructicola]